MVSVTVDHGWLIVTIQGLVVGEWPPAIRCYSGATLWMFFHRTPLIFGSCFSTVRNCFQGPIYLCSQNAVSGFWDRFLRISGKIVLWWLGGSCQFAMLRACRIYTGPLYRTIKSCLSNSGELVLWSGEQCLQTAVLWPNCTRHWLCLLDFQLEWSFSGYVQFCKFENMTRKIFFLNTFPGVIFVKYVYAIMFDILKAFSSDPF